MAKRSFGKKAYSVVRQLDYKAGPIEKKLGSKAVDIASSKAAIYLVNTLATTAGAALL